MKVFVTGVGGQLGHDVVNDLIARGYDSIGSDIAESYRGVQDGSFVTLAPYVQLDITDKDAVYKTICEIMPDAIIHCAAWTAVDAAEDEERIQGSERLKEKLWTLFEQNCRKSRISMMRSMPCFWMRKFSRIPRN